jgi:hypothetical protein
MSDYLWDKSGPPDDDVAELERLLGRFGATTPPPAWQAGTTAVRTVSWRSLAFLGAAAVLVLACGLAIWRGHRSPADAWPVLRVAGTPLAGRVPVGESAHLGVGEWLETDQSSRAVLSVSTIGRLDVEPGTRLRLLETRAGAHRLAMSQGVVHAFIWAPPGQFVVDTPSSRTVDLGCAYTLDVRPDGTGFIEVTAGWVAFEHGGRESLIPAGARCATRPGVGPGTPYFEDAPESLVEALTALDFGTSDAVRGAAVPRIIGMARPEDAVTLWHVLARVAPADRDAVFDALAKVVSRPRSVTRDGIRHGDAAMRDAWWNALGHGDIETWRAWKRRW